MALTIQQSKQIKDYLIGKIRNKLSTYTPETNYMPFHFRLLGKDRMAIFSFIQAVNTMLGISIFEQVGKLIAEPKPYERWTLQGLFDLSEEVLVGYEFWDLLGGENTYEDLLKIFEQAGLELYDEIDKKFQTLK